MLSNEEKGRFVKLLIEKIPNKIDEDTLYSEIHRFLMADTSCGKLYKYRSFNETALNNLENQTLYGALPSTFNDPFDSKIGIDLQSFMEAKYNLEFDVVEKIFADYLAVLYRKKELESCAVDNRDAVIRLLQNEQINSFYRKLMKYSFSLEEQKEILIKNANMVIDIVSTIISDDNMRKQMEIASSMLPRVMDKVNIDGEYKMCEYPESFGDFAKSLGVEVDCDEITLAKLIYQNQFPDKCIQANQMDKTFSDIDKRMSKAVDNMFRVVSLATDCKNRLMWSHYADAHKGFCIEYDFNVINNDNDYAFILPVIYSNIRPKFPWRVIMDENVQNTPFADIMIALLTKDEAWSYEREWRVLIPVTLSKSEIVSPPITGIYLGALCNEENRIRISKIANKLEVPIMQMFVDRGEYNLHAQLLE